ncbi:MAG: hypothetical protein RIS35_1181 [Pseudomonadota bacterium]|jgi:uncharacterized membrane protein YedE/YeeE
MIESIFPNGVQHYLVGGLLIGAAVGLIFVTTGLVAGMSSVFSSTWSFFSRLAFFGQPRFVESRGWRLVLAAGLVLGAWLCTAALGDGESFVTTVPAWQLLLGGAIAGFGARLANGCTSGHGICGLGSLQLPSLAAVLVFMATAFVTANLVAASGGV